jgi:N-acetyl-gamma-glutamyl-phosphate reductase
MTKKSIGIIGARGYTGAELITLLAGHEGFELTYVSSRELAGERLADHVDAFDGELRFEELSPENVADYGADACVLALPNGISAPFIEAIERKKPETVIVDLSADHRFDDNWTYGQPERFRQAIADATRIANPGCYATGMQLGLAPVVDFAIAPPQVFGVSGYSGAGTTPSAKNDLELLGDNLMPYALTEHTHEREVTRHLAHQVHFTPHVAPFFRGITLTISVQLGRPKSAEQIRAYFVEAYADEPLIELVDDIPLVKDNAGEHVVRIGGISVDEAGEHLVLVVTLDNLLKGAATQALQNLNLSCGFNELDGISS